MVGLMAMADNDSGDEGCVKQELRSIKEEAMKLRRMALLSGPAYQANARVSIAAGSGGTEAMDFASMLLESYSRWSRRESFRCDVSELVPGPVAGIRSAELVVSGPGAYGLLRCEAGAHRFRRFSPWGVEAGKKRQTSFAKLVVWPVVDDDEIFTLKMSEVRFDVMRSSGPGGQGVNTTSSAVRVTHTPTGISAANQDQRSLFQNKHAALAVLRGRLLERAELEARKKRSEIALKTGEARFGAGQIRSWSMTPSLVKDHRTGMESTDIRELLEEGRGLTEFMLAYLEHEVFSSPS